MIKNSSVEKERSCASIHGSGTPAEHPCRAASPLNLEGILQGKVPLQLPQPCGVFSQGNSKGFAASHPGTLCSEERGYLLPVQPGLSLCWEGKEGVGSSLFLLPGCIFLCPSVLASGL